MAKLHEMQERRALAVSEMRAINDKAEAEKRDYSDAENDKHKELKTELAGLDRQIERARDLQEAERAAPAILHHGRGDGNYEKRAREFSLVKAINAQLGEDVDDGFEREISSRSEAAQRPEVSGHRRAGSSISTPRNARCWSARQRLGAVSRDASRRPVHRRPARQPDRRPARRDGPQRSGRRPGHSEADRIERRAMGCRRRRADRDRRRHSKTSRCRRKPSAPSPAIQPAHVDQRRAVDRGDRAATISPPSSPRRSTIRRCSATAPATRRSGVDQRAGRHQRTP